MKKFNLFSWFVITGTLIVSCTTDKEVADQETPVAVRIAVPSQETGDNVSVSGQLESHNTAVISTRMMGFISGITVNPGDKVTKGQLLVTISSEDVQARQAQAV